MTEDDEELTNLKHGLTAHFEMKDLGEVKRFLGMKIEHESNDIKIHQTNYIHTLLHRHGMQDCNPVNTPMDPSIKLTAITNSNVKIDSSQYQQYIDELMFAAIATRPDIMFAISQLSSYNSNSYQDWERDLDTRRFITGFVVLLNDAIMMWKSCKQSTIALSTTKAEYMALTDVAKEIKWIRQLFDELNYEIVPRPPIILKTNNQGVLALAKNPVNHSRSKYIDIKHHFIHETIAKGII